MKNIACSVMVVALLAVIPGCAVNTVEQCPNQDALQTEIAKARKTVQDYKIGHVIVGRVVLDGPGQVRDVRAQMEILNDGYFAGPVKDLSRPIGFRMHQYAPYDVQLKDFSKDEKNDWIDVGTIHMKPLNADQLLDLKAHIALVDSGDPSQTLIEITVTNGPVNTPSNGTSPRSHWPQPIKLSVPQDGNVYASGFSPIGHWCRITAKDYLTKSFHVNFNEGQTLDLGTIIIEKPRQIELSYVVSETSSFDLDKLQTVTIPAGTRWKATDSIYGWDLEFKQDQNAVSLSYSYAPCRLWDLGDKPMEQLTQIDQNALGPRLRRNPAVQSGHVYLVDQQHWKRWILVKITLE